MSLIKVNKNENPYYIIGEYIEKHITCVDDIITVISLDGNIINELFLVENTTESNFIWQNDWWEGEENVELVDFFFVSDACKKCDNNDLISRQSAVDELVKMLSDCFYADEEVLDAVETTLKALPSAQPEIIRCRECKFASGDSRICMKFDHSPIGELDFCSWAERREVTT